MNDQKTEIYSYHYPPELLKILVNVIPKLCMSKKDLLLFFRGAGVKKATLQPYEELLLRDRDSFKKYDVTRELLAQLNEQGDQALAVRRQIIKRITEIEDHDICYPNERDAARGLVAQVREIVNRKDAFTRMRIEKDNEKLNNIRQKEAALAVDQKKKERIKKVQSDLSSLIVSKDPHKRGKALVSVLNELFDCYGILVSEAFTISGDYGEGIIEQIDGLTCLDKRYYFVEMKWWNKEIGRREISEHLVKIANRGGNVRGLFISYSKYTEPAIIECRNALNRNAVVVLATLEEIFKLLDNEGDLKTWLRKKERAAIIDRKPLYLDC